MHKTTISSYLQSKNKRLNLKKAMKVLSCFNKVEDHSLYKELLETLYTDYKHLLNPHQYSFIHGSIKKLETMDKNNIDDEDEFSNIREDKFKRFTAQLNLLSKQTERLLSNSLIESACLGYIEMADFCLNHFFYEEAIGILANLYNTTSNSYCLSKAYVISIAIGLEQNNQEIIDVYIYKFKGLLNNNDIKGNDRKVIKKEALSVEKTDINKYNLLNAINMLKKGNYSEALEFLKSNIDNKAEFEDILGEDDYMNYLALGLLAGNIMNKDNFDIAINYIPVFEMFKACQYKKALKTMKSMHSLKTDLYLTQTNIDSIIKTITKNKFDEFISNVEMISFEQAMEIFDISNECELMELICNSKITIDMLNRTISKKPVKAINRMLDEKISKLYSSISEQKQNNSDQVFIESN